MLLALDVGNTNINVGIFARDRLKKKFSIPTERYGLKVLKKKLSRVNINDVIICSVVPHISLKLEKDIRGLFKEQPYVLGKNIEAPIKNRYRNPSEVGQDRLVNAYSCVSYYGSPAICLDFGTAITFDAISEKREYKGGAIVPGLELSLETLSKRAALLPSISLKRPTSVIGRDTIDSMRSGIVYGISALTDGLIKRLRKKIGLAAVVIATGGNARFISRFCKSVNKVDNNLTLNGLNLIYKYQKTSKNTKN